MIPNGWQASTISELAEVDPEVLSSATDLSEEIDYISLEDVSRGRLLASTRLAFAEAPSRARRVIREGDVLFGTVRPNLQSHLYFEGGFRRPVASTGFAVVRATRENDPRFIYFSLMSDRTQTQVDRIIAGSNYPAVSSRDVRALSVLAPPPREQRAIAEALSDADALVESLDALIAKKRDMKQAAMQQLLTGRTRLPGFSEQWIRRQVGDCLTIEHGRNQSQIVDPAGRYPILATGGEIGRTNAFLHGGPSVLIGRKGTIDRPQYMATPFWTVDTLFYSRVRTGFLAKFLYFKFLMIDWRSFNEASGVPSLNASTIERVEILVPPIEEQQAITEVLSDMDTEIDALVAQREKAEFVKQGMMQELLSGRVRLA